MSDTKTICRECGETITSSGCVMVACPKCSLIQYAIRPVKLSNEGASECPVTGCDKPAFPYTDSALLPEGYVDACRDHAAMLIGDTVKEGA